MTCVKNVLLRTSPWYFDTIAVAGRWNLLRFAQLIPSGYRLPPIHLVMSDHASIGLTPAAAFSAGKCHRSDIALPVVRFVGLRNV